MVFLLFIRRALCTRICILIVNANKSSCAYCISSKLPPKIITLHNNVQNNDLVSHVLRLVAGPMGGYKLAHWGRKENIKMFLFNTKKKKLLFINVRSHVDNYAFSVYVKQTCLVYNTWTHSRILGVLSESKYKNT